jgi:hypothetical protein
MKKITLIAIICSVAIYRSIAQDMYFISGHPFPNISTQFSSFVYKYQDDTLAPKFQISKEDILLEYVKVYPDQHVATAITREYKTLERRETLCIIHTNKPDTVYRIKIELPVGMRCTHSNLIGLSDIDVFECFKCSDPQNMQKPMKDRVRKIYGWNVYDFSKQELSTDDYKNVIVSGSPAAALEGWDYIQLYSNSNNGELVLPVTPDTLKRPIFPYSLPDSLLIKKNKLLAIAVDNSRYIAILTGDSGSSSKEIGTSNLLIYNKQKLTWYSFVIKGSNNSFRGFGSWLAGSVVSNDHQLIYNEKGAVKDQIKFNRVSPGKENRRQKGTSTGTPFDFRTDLNNLYYPGILYLLNVPTRKYIEWNTDQGDSEILLVQNEIVYYRVNDQILKVPILNSEKLGKPELLIKDPRVPDIHWAFISEK